MTLGPVPAQPATPDPRRWLVLAVGMLAMTAACAFQFGLANLIPALRDGGLSLHEAGLLVAAPSAGLLLTLIAWGAAADRWGERVVLATGLTVAGVVLLLASRVGTAPAMGACFLVAGAAGAAAHASSGRLIMGWFAAGERGLAMGIRQTAQPAGVALAALTLPGLAGASTRSALTFLGLLSLLAANAVALLVRDPARSAAVPGATPGAASGSPYRTPVLWRIHAASALLIVPQFAVSTFAVVLLVDGHGFDPVTAGRALAGAQIASAALRLLAGWWSDRVQSRLRPMRTVALVIGAVVGVLAVSGGTPLAVVALLVAAAVTAAPNGLAFTAVAEHAGRAWSGRALGVQNTAQNAVAAAAPPVLGALIGAVGPGPAFLAVLPLPLLAAAVVPARAERDHADTAETIPDPARAPAAGSGTRP
ncbi:MFS transporter [Cellulosimicrobium cellulans]|uniref:MFS transporter n=1 Tax=Cellulosimicrobium cellulans TaxID=1710 RepID=UPI00130EC21B|nr:MFS transporter [Cellulosimicrobium cellulans]